ncbi:DUF397 domain-containing protein [Amycolatopsis sp. H20-H5]|uniref:DUF397 domain-containing protein n=1 Tax=Amycolatopsis sp. H20-H5 TaxID=3046309 RepID=UPI002DB6F761|nr:DUF397 domain-containing protein [Amycolatopsis sp. H20-H5]MEC3974653.1 DUF397 domain-containing protein [Amycolatopsis sp. H20-H5]
MRDNRGSCLSSWQATTTSRRRSPLMPEWRKSKFSNANDDCVEVALDPAEVGVRDSKAPASGQLGLPVLAWEALLSRLTS